MTATQLKYDRKELEHLKKSKKQSNCVKACNGSYKLKMTEHNRSSQKSAKLRDQLLIIINTNKNI